MKKYLTAVAFAAALVQPASAITFSKLTTIYVGSGVTDSAHADLLGSKTAFICSNVSGQNATLRFLVLGKQGGLSANASTTVPHGGTRVAVTNPVTGFLHDLNLTTSAIGHGVINIESTQSGVFCNAIVVEADKLAVGYPLCLVRINPHPGSVE